MLTVKKFTSFEELKADAKEAENYELSMQRHKEFEKVFKHIRSIIVQNEKVRDQEIKTKK